MILERDVRNVAITIYSTRKRSHVVIYRRTGLDSLEWQQKEDTCGMEEWE